MNVELLTKTVTAMIRSGLAGQTRPWHLPALWGTWKHTGPSLAGLVAIAAIHRPDQPAILDERGSITYRELDEAAARTAQGLSQVFGSVGSVAVMCRNHRGLVVAMAAAGRLGADLLLVNTEFSGPQLSEVLGRIEADVIVADEEFLPLLETTSSLIVVAWHDRMQQRRTLDSLIADHEPYRAAGQPARAKLTLLSSGTTGRPKGASRTPGLGTLLPPLVTTLLRGGLSSGQTIQIAVPLFHGFGLCLWILAALLRSPVVLHRKFDPESALAAAAKHHSTALALVPVMAQRLVELPESAREQYDLGALRMVLSGGAPLRSELAVRFAATFGPVLFNGYGSSEVGIATLATPDDLRLAPGTVGRPCVATPVHVLDPHGQIVPTGHRGGIHVGGPGVFIGYSDGGSKSVVDGLMSTGDVGHFDGVGRLFIDGREDDMIISGGENVYPGEVEETLARHPEVADVAVLGVEDDEYGQRLVAFVVARDHAPSDAQLRAHVKNNLARYKVPREFVFVHALPRNATGKLLRSELSGQHRHPTKDTNS